MVERNHQPYSARDGPGADVAGAPRIDWPRSIRLTLAYDGSRFHGWQVQPATPTIQGALIDACARVLGSPVRVTGASRTDAGVHALGQVASVWTASSLPAATLGRALNALLPDDVRVVDVRDAPPGFDARRWATGKRYLYLVDTGPFADPFFRCFAWHVPARLDVPSMAKALSHLRGRHDFSAFCASPGRDRTPVCTVRSLRLALRRQRLALILSGDSFLHHMVRNIAGSLVEVGRGARPPEWIAEVLAGRDRTGAGPTAPARGLVLLRVLYHGDGAGRPRSVEQSGTRSAEPPDRVVPSGREQGSP
jgi:tRNA pseudouridine38-40 synthase